MNGDPETYTNWASGEPNDGSPNGGNADYTVIAKSDGKWYDRNGNDHYEYVVEIPCMGDPPSGPCTDLLANWTLDNCESFSSNGSNNDYSELTASTSTPNGTG